MLTKMLEQSLSCYRKQKIVQEGREYTFEELYGLAGRLAAELSGSKYGIFCKNKLHCMAAALACLKAHKTAVLLCPEYGTVFNRKLVEKTDIHNFIQDKPDGKLEVKTEDVQKEAELEEVAFIIHTSGSTGEAKGVMLTQENVMSNIKSTLQYYPITEESKILLYRPIYHTTTVFGEFLMTLMAGAKLYVEPSSMPFTYYARILKKLGITHLAGTPTFFHQLADGQKKEKDFQGIEVISVGGECMTEQTARKLLQKFTKTKIYACYGMTEASPRVSYLPPEYFGKDYRCIGRPLHGVKIGLFDEKGQKIQEADCVGEIAVQGPGIMKGYYRDQAATEKVLKGDWYFTGDCGFWKKDGLLYFQGRRDSMCIRAGVNIWLGDIEREIEKHPSVEHVHVTYQEDKEAIQLAAWVQGAGLTEEALMAWCLVNLQKHYIPDRIEMVATIPVTGCGKKGGK